ncbi:hypothetical protein L500_3802 [Bordetella holmesii CDC-H643-BH]|nr:hypothetical protein L573_2312 [Bordetella holmesii H620]KCV18577.1 hypothetical protein L500_3802 [Bordetella holmesii CDC-H643-BH]
MQQGLQSVERFGKARVVAAAGFELLPQRVEGFALIGRQQCKDTQRGSLLTLGLAGLRRCVMKGGVAGIDLDDVVDQQHLDYAQHIDGRGGVLRQRERVQRQMPGMLGAVFAARRIDERRLAQDALELVYLSQEGELALQRGGIHAGVGSGCCVKKV